MDGEGRMIVVDDDWRLLSIYKRFFSTFPIRLFCTTSHKLAMEVAFYSPPNVFMTDLINPEINGRDVIATLRAHKDTKDIRIWLVSGYVGSLPKKEKDTLDADVMLEKPCRWENLAEIMQREFKSKNKDIALLNVGVESPDLDYKEDIDLENRDSRASFAKDVIAFANYGGGNIIVGVAEPRKGVFERVGISEEKSEKLEVTSLNKAIQDYIEPVFHISSRRLCFERKCFQLISIPGVRGGPVLARKENLRAKLFLARVYTRTNAAESKEVVRGEELRRLLDCIRQR